MPLNHGLIRPRTCGFEIIYPEMLATLAYFYTAILHNSKAIRREVFFQITAPL